MEILDDLDNARERLRLASVALNLANVEYTAAIENRIEVMNRVRDLNPAYSE